MIVTVYDNSSMGDSRDSISDRYWDRDIHPVANMCNVASSIQQTGRHPKHLWNAGMLHFASQTNRFCYKFSLVQGKETMVEVIGRRKPLVEVIGRPIEWLTIGPKL